jgi:hypothetical protein
MDDHPLRKGMVMTAECSARTTHALMEYLYRIAIDGRKYPATGAGGHRADRGIPCRLSTALPNFLDNTALIHETVDPVLRGTPRYLCPGLDIRHRK